MSTKPKTSAQESPIQGRLTIMACNPVNGKLHAQHATNAEFEEYAALSIQYRKLGSSVSQILKPATAHQLDSKKLIEAAQNPASDLRFLISSTLTGMIKAAIAAYRANPEENHPIPLLLARFDPIAYSPN